VTRASSRTAELMAVQRGLESTHPSSHRLFCDPLARRFVSRRWRVVLAVSRLPWLRRLIEFAYDQVGGPGPRASAVSRTRLIDDIVTGLASSLGQFVILGAGFDSRPYRLAGLGALQVFEVDHPSTQRAKRQTLDRTLDPVPSRVHFVPVDFEHDDLNTALRAAGYDDEVASAFLWEGVTNYLTPAAVDATLAAVRALLNQDDDTVVFTYVDRAVIVGNGVERFPEARRWIDGVRRRGEPWTFGLDPTEVATFLAQRGFTLLEDVSTAEAGQRYFAPLGRHERGSDLYHVVTAKVGAGTQEALTPEQ
jgi:methyltransferase (TIGR00027 family)